MEKIKDLAKKYPGKKVLIQLNLWDKKKCEVLIIAPNKKKEAELKKDMIQEAEFEEWKKLPAVLKTTENGYELTEFGEQKLEKYIQAKKKAEAEAKTPTPKK